jgi:methionyl aminopeptidase
MGGRALIKSASEIEAMRAAGAAAAVALRAMAVAVEAGARRAVEIDAVGRESLIASGARPALIGYQPPFHGLAYRHASCISVNEVVVHGVPREELILRDGDIASLDIVAELDGWFGDCAVTVPVGQVSNKARKLISATQKALEAGIRRAEAGKHLGGISDAINQTARKHGFVPAHGLSGHGIGREIHEEPYVPNIGGGGEGVMLTPGMTFCIEPMIVMGVGNTRDSDADQWGVRTVDGLWAAHFEHTVAITEDGPLILTI